MTPEEKIIFENLAKQVELLTQKLDFFVSPDRYIFKRDVEWQDGRRIIMGKSTGLQIGTSTNQILGFFQEGVVQQGPISDASGGLTVDTQARAAINTLLDDLRGYGLIKN